MRKSLWLILLLVAGALTLSGCCRGGVDYEYAVNNDLVQLGCAAHIPDEKPDSTPPERGSLFRFGLPWWIGDNKSRPACGLAWSLLADADTHGRGAAVAPLLFREYMAGVVCGFLVGANEVQGVSIAYINVISGRCNLQIGVLNAADFLYTSGYVDVQLGAFINGGGGAGVQIAPFNQSNGRNRFQFGLVNLVETEKEKSHRGCQIGVVNITTGGFQIGLININDNPTLFRVFPLVNF